MAKRPESKTSVRHLEAAGKRAAAVELRKQGLTYAEIASRVGFDSEAGARKTVNTALEKLIQETTETAEEVRRLELERLDAMLIAIWPAATATEHTETIAGEAFTAAGPDTRQVAAALKLMERRAKLLGLDAPAKHEVAGVGGSALLPQQPVRDLLENPEARDLMLAALDKVSGQA